MIVPDELHRLPRYHTVKTTLHEDVVVAGVGGIVLSPFAEGEDCPLRGHKDRWDAIGMIAILATCEEIRLFRQPGRRRRGTGGRKYDVTSV